MAKSTIIKDLVNNEVTLEQSLYRLLVISYDLDDSELINWIENELNGYGEEDVLPDYRQVYGVQLRYTGINGSYQVTNHPLPSHYISEKYRDIIRKFEFRESIKTIDQVFKSEKQLGKDLTFLAADIEENTGIQCFKITGYCNMMEVGNLITTVKSKVLKVLITLEKEFGVLDKLDIDIEEGFDLEEVSKEINLILYDNSVSIGNNNKIEGSKFLIGSDDSGN